MSLNNSHTENQRPKASHKTNFDSGLVSVFIQSKLQVEKKRKASFGIDQNVLYPDRLC